MLYVVGDDVIYKMQFIYINEMHIVIWCKITFNARKIESEETNIQ